MRLLTVQEAAEFLRVTQARTYQLLRSGFIPGVRIGRQLRVDESALHQWVARGGHPLPRSTVKPKEGRRVTDSGRQSGSENR
jgi:excisionase family DNA binding protein